MTITTSSRFAPSAIALAFAALLAACASNPAPGSRSVTIERTTYGIAHITAPDYEGIAYGVAYAHAQDNVCQTAEHLLTVRGERAQFLGAQATGELGLGRLPNTQIDLFVRAHMDDAALARAAAANNEDVKASLRGYVAGYNRYLQDAGPNGLPEACRNKPWVRPMSLADLSRTTEMSMIQGGIGALAGAVLAAAPPAPGTRNAAEPVALQQAVAEIGRHSFNANPEGGELGSNGWAFGRNATPDGRGLVLGNPHFPWAGTNRFWEMHLTIPGQLDVMGATGGLSPVVAIGFNKDVAWTHTVSTGKRFTLYELKLDPADPTVYIVDGQRKKMTTRIVSLPAVGGPAPPKTFYSTEWGPVVSLPRAGLGWTATTAYAIRDANTQNVRSAQSWMQMALARNVGELRAAMGNQGMPWINTIAADREGNAMYADLSVVPDVSAEMLKACAPSPRAAALLNAAGLPVLDGSRSACAWNRDAAVAMPGVTAPARMPVVVTPDWVQNSNDSFWLSNPHIEAPAGISPLVGFTGTPQRLRTRSGIMEIEARLAGNDGLRGDKMGAAELRSVIFRDRNLAGMLVADDLVAACNAGASALTPDQALGCRVLAAWDRTSNGASKGAPLFREFWRKAKDVPKVWRVPFDPTRPVATPAGLDMATPATREAVFKALGDAVAIVRTAGFAADVPLAEVQTRTVRGQKVAIHGGDEFEGVLNKVESQGQSLIDPKGYNINYGSSYMQVVGFDQRGPVAQAILTYGQSSDPASPRAYDQLPLFAAKQWHPLPFHRADIEAQRVGAPSDSPIERNSMNDGLDQLVQLAGAVPLAPACDHFYFLRHGQTEGNAQRIFQAVNTPLSVLGLQQATRAAELLAGEPIRSVVCSDAKRAFDTAHTVAAGLRIAPLVLESLRERNFGALIGTSSANLDWACEPEGGETLAQFIARKRAALEVALAHPAPVLVVAHGGSLHVLAALLGVAIDLGVMGNAQPLRFERNGPTWRVKPLLQHVDGGAAVA